MAAIFDEVTLTWGTTEDSDGNEVPAEWTITPTYRMVQAIEQRISVAGMADRAAKRQIPATQVAYVLSFLLNSSGCKVSEEDIYTELMHSSDEKWVEQAINVAITAFNPSKKSASQGSKKKRAGKKRSAKR